MAPALCFFLMYVLCYYFDLFHISQAMLLHEIGGMNEYVCMYVQVCDDGSLHQY